MSYFNFTNEDKVIYSCKDKEEFWFCLKNLSLKVLYENWKNSRLLNICLDKEELKKVKFIISERIASLKLRTKHPKMFRIRNGEYLPMSTLERNRGKMQEFIGVSTYECPSCGSKLDFVKHNKKLEMWCPDCEFYLRNIGD